MPAPHHPEAPMAIITTTTDAPVADRRPKGRPIGTYTTDAGAQRRIWRQDGRDGIRLVDVAFTGRGPGYLIEGSLTAGEPEALAADCLPLPAELGDCPMRTSRVAWA